MIMVLLDTPEIMDLKRAQKMMENTIDISKVMKAQESTRIGTNNTMYYFIVCRYKRQLLIMR